MASFQSFGGLRSMKSNEKVGRPRNKVVKPILKKLSQSEKSSLDLDRGWDEQDEQYQNRGLFCEPGVTRSGSARDVSFAFTIEASASSGLRFNHSRSISGNSHVSVATSGSGSGVGAPTGRSGSTFVHPFQQIPRTATPPLSYANSLASFDARDYSTTITEDDDDYYDPTTSHRSLHPKQPPTSNSQAHYSHSQPSSTCGNPILRRPSLTSQRTNSYTDIANQNQPLRINTTRSISTTPAQSSRLAHVSSRSDLSLDIAAESPESPHATSIHRIASPSSSIAPMSPFSRSSFEAANFPRLRAKSDLDTATRAEHLREARRKFEAKEQAKEEKWAREEIRRLEKADNKRAHELERQAAAMRKERDAEKRRLDAAALAEAMPPGSKHTRKISGTSSSRPSTSCKAAPGVIFGQSEKFVSGNYDSMETCSPPSFGNQAGGANTVVFEKAKRTNTAKRKTHGAWTMFILWLRTRLLKLSKDS